MKRSVLVFAAVLAAFAGLAWLSGYDFDKRNFWVAWYSAMALWAAFGCAVAAKGLS